MPFTFSHPGAVLPFNLLKKNRLSLTGLVAGSMIPDIEYYIRMENIKVYTHTWGGLFLYDVPLAILAAYIFHNVVRNPFINNSPHWLQARLARYTFFNWNLLFKKQWPLVIFSILIGGVTHLLLDAFAHENGEIAMRIPFLVRTNQVAGVNIEGWMIIQIITSLIGLLIVIYSVWQLPHPKQATLKAPRYDYWLIVVFITVIIFFAKRITDANSRVEFFVIPAISGFLLAIVVTPLLLKYRFKKS